MKYYLAIKKDKIVPYVMTWMGLESFILSEIRQGQILSDVPCMRTIKTNQNPFINQAHRCRQQISGCPGWVWEWGKWMKDGQRVQTFCYNMSQECNIQHGDYS